MPSTRSTTGCATDRTGRGYVTEAAQPSLRGLATALGATRIVLNAGMENRRSLAVAERLGFTRDGELEGGMHGGSVGRLSRIHAPSRPLRLVQTRCA